MRLCKYPDLNKIMYVCPDYIESVQKLSSSPLLQPAVSAKPILKSPLQQSTPTSRMGAADFF